MTEGATKLFETLADPKWGPSFFPAHTPWNKVTGQPMAMFDYWAQVRFQESFDTLLNDTPRALS